MKFLRFITNLSAYLFKNMTIDPLIFTGHSNESEVKVQTGTISNHG